MIEGCTNRLCVVGLPKEKTKTEEKKVIDITIGVFFDGTGNNKYSERSNFLLIFSGQ